MSPERVSPHVGLAKRNDLYHRYQVPFAQLLTFILPPFACPACHLVAVIHQYHWLPKCPYFPSSITPHWRINSIWCPCQYLVLFPP
ncbi:unnamed protein product [Protopolystoma xenopodis]|uniref:Uncharacterized protein n=1 Tax=Protopolystoma xenopodis TaxID=117903 RepID=A0A3S5AZP7_9PLAT|nr:unnamed protein product [Protopolystoma xenopodis]